MCLWSDKFFSLRESYAFVTSLLNDPIATATLTCDNGVSAITVVLRVATAWGMESLILLKLKHGVYI